MWGKAKIAAAIAEELRPLNLAASESTVGRILADLVKRGAHKHGAVGEWLADHPRWTLGLLKTPRSVVHGT